MSLAANPLQNPRETKAARHRFYTSGLGPTRCPAWGKAFFLIFMSLAANAANSLRNLKEMQWPARQNRKSEDYRKTINFFLELSGGQKFRFFFENMGGPINLIERNKPGRRPGLLKNSGHFEVFSIFMSLAANPLRNPRETKGAKHRFYRSGLGPTRGPAQGKAIFQRF